MGDFTPESAGCFPLPNGAEKIRSGEDSYEVSTKVRELQYINEIYVSSRKEEFLGSSKHNSRNRGKS